MKRKIHISDLILLSFEKAIDGLVRFADLTENPGYYAYWDGWNYPLKKNSLGQALRRLRLNGYVDLEQYNKELMIKLTNTGKIEADLRKALFDEKWDGKWRVVIFDIPEKHKRARDLLRSKLKTWGFVSWQKSVWASKKNITHILRDFIKQSGVVKWVVVVETVDDGSLAKL